MVVADPLKDSGQVGKVILPNRGNARTAAIIVVPLAVAPIIIGFLQGRLIESGIWWQAPLCPLIFLTLVLLYLRGQRVVLSKGSITHRHWHFFKFITKTFRYEDLDYWYTEYFVLIVVRKGGKRPKLPYDPFSDLSNVLIIPLSLFYPRTTEITDFLVNKGVLEKK